MTMGRVGPWQDPPFSAPYGFPLLTHALKWGNLGILNGKLDSHLISNSLRPNGGVVDGLITPVSPGANVLSIGGHFHHHSFHGDSGIHGCGHGLTTQGTTTSGTDSQIGFAVSIAMSPLMEAMGIVAAWLTVRDIDQGENNPITRIPEVSMFEIMRC